MKNNLKLIWNILQVFVLCFIFIVTFFVININEYGYSKIGRSTFISVTNKEKKYIKDFNNGDLLIIKNDKINKKDKFYYYTVDSYEYLITEAKLSDIKDDCYITEDNLKIEQDRIIGNKVIRIKYIGFILGFLLKDIGYFIFIILPMLGIFIYHVYDFFKSMRKLNKIKIANISRCYNNNEFNKSIRKAIDEIEVLDDEYKKEDIEILDF